MPIFKVDQTKLTPIKEKSIDLEKDIQKLTEENLETIFGYKFVCSEFQLNNLRIDTLAFDPENNSFIIIEYKKDCNLSVIDQGYAYLALMLNNKAEFLLVHNEKMSNNLKKDSVDWSQTRVIFVSPQFTPYQRGAIDFKDLPIELWEVKKYDNNTILYNQLKPASTSESIKTVSKDKTISAVSREVREYSIEDHLEGKPKEIFEIYHHFRNKIFELGNNINEVATKSYIAYRNPRINFVTFHVYKTKLRVSLIIDDKNLKDPKKIVRKYPSSYGFAKNLKYFEFNLDSDFDYALGLISQAYEFNSGRWE